LFLQLKRLADSRIFCTAGKSNPINTPMMATTTSNSIKEKPERRRAMVTSPLIYSGQ
jgi:hypothetical protein